jgi:HEAT repeat protein
VTSTNLEEYAAHYLARITDDENAEFALAEAPSTIMPLLVSAFRAEPDALKRSAIIKVIWQRRDPATIPVLAEGLRDSSPRVWKEALDGLVTIGSPQSISAIQGAYDRRFDSEDEGSHFRAFLDEALDQLRGGFFRGQES